MSQFATLIVEDTPDIQGSYQRAVERQGGHPVIVGSYDEAVEAIKRRLFPVAIIDVRLSEEDETNIDGLKVLEFIRKSGDKTKAILITGYGSFQIAREAFQQYEVFEGLEKGVSLATIEATIKNAHKSFQNESSRESQNYPVILKGSGTAVWEWEDRARRMCSPTSGVDGLYRFLAALLSDFTPVLDKGNIGGCTIKEALKIAAGVFWSRGKGEAVLVAFGQKSQVLKLQSKRDPAELNDFFYESPGYLDALLKKVEAHGIYGIVRRLEDQSFTPFDLSEPPR